MTTCSHPSWVTCSATPLAFWHAGTSVLCGHVGNRIKELISEKQTRVGRNYFVPHQFPYLTHHVTIKTITMSELGSIFPGEGASTQRKHLFFVELHFKPDSSAYTINNYSKENKICMVSGIWSTLQPHKVLCRYTQRGNKLGWRRKNLHQAALAWRKPWPEPPPVLRAHVHSVQHSPALTTFIQYGKVTGSRARFTQAQNKAIRTQQSHAQFSLNTSTNSTTYPSSLVASTYLKNHFPQGNKEERERIIKLQWSIKRTWKR